MINNQFYDILGDEWYTRNDHPIALLRAENRLRSEWVKNEIKKQFPNGANILDVGCGGGFLSNALAHTDSKVTGVDISTESLNVAKRHDTTNSVQYLKANAYELPFENEQFDVVLAMDILEHVDHPARLIHEASRVLKSEGIFFFHTFNRNFFSFFVVIKGVDWFVKNAPKNIHVYSLFIKPRELMQMMQEEQLNTQEIQGFVPKLFSKAALKLLATREVPDDFSFKFTRDLSTGYCGFAKKS